MGGDEVRLKPILEIMPMELRQLIQSLPEETKESLEEIRIRLGGPLEIIAGNRSWFVTEKGTLLSQPNGGKVSGSEECRKLLNLISQHSLYAMEEELRQGYITVEGGHRIGLAGKVITEGGRVRHLREVTAFNIRIARQITGVATPILPHLYEDGMYHSLLIISPPQCGKTTLLRDLARLVSNGTPSISSQKVGIVDERSEIAGCIRGVSQHDVGVRTDILDACPKAEGMMMMIRSMSPQVLLVDEIGRQEDAEAIHEAVCAGVTIFTSAHGQSLAEVARRPHLHALIKQQLFGRYILLSRRLGAGTIESILDSKGEKIRSKIC